MPCVARLINWVIFTVVFMHIHSLIELTKHHIIFLVVEFADVEFQATIVFTSWENLRQSFTLFVSDINLIPVHQGHKVVHKYDTLIVWVWKLLDLFYKLFPISFQMLKYFLVNANAIVLLHFEMKLAEVIFAENCLPTLSMLAIFLPIFFVWAYRGFTTTRCWCWGASLESMIGIILPKIETFGWVDFATHSHLEVFIGNFAIAIQIEFVKEHLKLFFSDTTETPMFKVEPKFFRLNCPWFFHIKVHKSFAKGFPLEFNFLKHCPF